MIVAQDYDDVLREIGKEFFISDILYVRDLKSWSRRRGIDLSEPSQPMKLITQGSKLIMFVQSEMPGEMLDNVIKALSVRWSLKDNVTDPLVFLNSVKKRLAFCFLKEYARTVKSVGGDDLLEDEWTMKKMETLGFFKE